MSDHGHTMTTSAPGNGVGTTESTGEITGLPVSAINDYESGACANGSTTDYSNGHGHGQDNGHETFTQEKHPSSHQTPRYNGEGARGPHLDRTLTPGGHLADNDLLAIAKSHRKVGSPLPLGIFSFSTTILLLSLYNIHVQSIVIPNAILGFALPYGGIASFISGICEFACGNTFGATFFCSFGMFWWGYATLLIPFFGFSGMYDGQAGIYANGSPYASEAGDALGLYLWIWFGITTIYLIASIRGSVSLFVLIFMIWLTFLCLGAHNYTGNDELRSAGGAFGIAAGFAGYYLGIASFLTPYNSFFTLPVIPLGKRD
ncbi:hypothetical protein EX895_000278 [Sporisorium graminicola]|uniref:Uncharacterized protein n=1 Tax=Sporisorium graminicola TaxID=280036 RepID=A0A4U7L0E6_9BASI|nr:hypothetical protein EX895_000278 [Sporisorium graminicola]TKY90280.1 hypothetical protein EX895_000278 [Sporisorium graminicola]